MSTVAIAAVGSRGDVVPLIGLGVRLLGAGHGVTVAAYPPFADLITRSGLRFRELPEAFDPSAERADVSPLKSLAAFLSPSGMRSMGRAVLNALCDEPADVLLLSPFAELAGHLLAEAKGIPTIGVRLQPLSATAAHPPAVLGAWSAGGVGNRFAADAGAWMIDRLYGRVSTGLRLELGLAPASSRSMRRARTRADWPVLHGYSSLVAPRPEDWRPGLEVTGYWWPSPEPGWQPPDALTDFLDAGPPPVFVGLGSTVTSPRQAARLSDAVRGGLRLAGVRGVVQAGWAGLEGTGDGLLTVGDVPHEWLFPRMGAVAHHCGAGTTAAGIRAGVPAIALPGVAGDQPFWARRLQDCGASAATIPQPKLTAERLAEAIHATVGNTRLRQSAQGLSERLDAEEGAGRAVAAIEMVMQRALG